MNNIILGAGVTGLAAGYKTGWPIYEKSNQYGGICTEYVKEGFKFSVGGGHWLFENEKTQEALDFVKSLVDLNSYERNAGVYYNHTFPYPIQTYTQKANYATPGTFKQWLGSKFSNEMCNMFFYPFNEKYTAGLFDEIIQFDSYKTPQSGGNGFVTRFHDPVEGLSHLFEKMAKKCQISHLMMAMGVDTEKKIVYFSNGDSVKYDKLISTIPLSQMLSICGKTGYDLPYSSVFVLNIGATPGPNFPRHHWVYVPFCKSNFYRIGLYSNVEANKAPEGMVGLSVEMAFCGYDYDDLDVPYIIQEVTNELKSWGFIDKVVVTDPTWVKHAYTWNRNPEEREEQIQWLKERDIICIGRYATWKFQGMLESIQQGLNVE